MKKILLLLILSIFINSFPAVVMAETGEKTAEQLVVEALTDVRIADDTDEVSRGEFCRIIYHIDREDVPEATVNIFTDVDIEDDYAGYIQNIYERGFVSGSGNMEFLPENKIKLCEAYVMLLKMAGYYYYLDGVYPDTVMRLASDSGLSKGIHKAWNDIVDKNTAYKLVHNLLFTKTLTKTGINTSETADMYMTEVLGIYEDKGVIEAVEGHSLYGEATRKEGVTINGFSMHNPGVVSYDDIGLFGKFYYKESEDAYEGYELIAFVPVKNEKVKLSSIDIESYANNVYKYDDGSKYKELRLDPKKDVMYNKEQAISESVMIPRYGTVTLIDNNSDNRYDVVIVDNYTNIYPTYVNTTDKIIKYYESSGGYTNNGELAIGDRECYVIDEEGRNLPINSIKKDSILTVYENTDEVYLYQTTNKIKGTITEIDSEYIVLGGEKVFLSKDIYRASWDGASFIEAEAYIDIFGNVGAIIPIKNTEWKYGYIIKNGYDESEETAWLKILSEDNTIAKYWAEPKKIRVDGIKAKMVNKADVESAIGSNCLIRYRLDTDGTLLAVDKESALSSFNLRSSNLSENDCLLKRHDGQTVYKNITKMFKMYGTTVQNTTLEGEAFYDSNTVIFNVPKTVKDSTTDDEYFVVTSLPEDLICRTASYNTEPSSLAADVVICYMDPLKTQLRNAARCMVVKKIKTAYYNDEFTYSVTGLYNGSETQKYVDIKIKHIFDSAEPGDYYRITVEGDCITAAELMYSQNGGGHLNSSYYFGVAAANAEMRYLIGKVVSAKDGHILFKYTTPTGDKMEILRADTFYVYAYDESKGSRERVYIGTVNDVNDVNSSGSINSDTVIISTRVTEGRDMYIIKNRGN